MSKRSSSSKSNPPFPNPFAFESDYWTEPQELELKDEIELPKADRDKLATRGYKTGKLIGTGFDAKVYLASRYKMPCAVKVIYGDYVHCKELYMLKHIKHPHVVQLFDLYVTCDRHLLIFMELLEGGSMKDYLKELKKSGRFLSEKQVCHYYLQIADAFRYMHSLGFAHRDFYEGNILLDDTKRVCKVSDFGHSNIIYDPSKGEMLENFCKEDIGHLGSLLQEMLTGNKFWSWELHLLIYAHMNHKDLDEILRDEPWLKMAL